MNVQSNNLCGFLNKKKILISTDSSIKEEYPDIAQILVFVETFEIAQIVVYVE